MNKTKFKVLTHLGEYVDANLLNKGIYSCEKPFIYSNNETIDTLIMRAKGIRDVNGNSFLSDSYFENLKLCQLTKVNIIKINE